VFILLVFTQLFFECCTVGASQTGAKTEFNSKSGASKGIGADSMGAMGAIAPTAKKLWGDAPKSPPQEF